MASKKSGLGGGLGGGLDGLFGGKKEVVAAVTKGEVTGEVKVADLVPNPYQPRKSFDPEALAELVASVREQGVIQPLIVRKQGNKYEIVAGERRWRAAKEVGLTTVPAVVRKYDEKAMMEVALIENMQRSDLNPVEEAEGVKAMMEKLKLTQAEVGQKLGKNRTAISNMLRLLELPAEVLQYVSAQELTLGQVKPLMALEDEAVIIDLAQKAVTNGWTARTLEEVAADYKAGLKVTVLRQKVAVLEGKGKKAGKKAGRAGKAEQLDVDLADFQERLTESFSTKVKVNPLREGKGKIVIEYYSAEDLERIHELLLGGNKKKKVSLYKGSFNV